MAEGRGSALKKILAWLIGLPVLAGAVLFALANPGALSLSFWPAQYTLTAPVYLILFAAILGGFVLGGAVAWVAFGRKRALLRRRAREIRRLEGELDDAQRRAAEAAPPPAGEPGRDEATRRQLIAANG